MKKESVRAVIMEVSSHALALDRVWGMEFQAAVFTNLTRDHLDFHPSYQEYGKAKAKLFGMLGQKGIAVINGDDPMGSMMCEATPGKKVTYGMKERSVDYRIEGIKSTTAGSLFHLQKGDKRITLSTNLWGYFNVMNVGAAAVVGLELGLEGGVIQKGIQKVSTIQGRMETIPSEKGFRVVIDYAHTPAALQSVLQAVRECTPNRVVVVFGCGGDRDKGKRPEMGKIAASLADSVYVTSDNPRTEDPAAIIDDIQKGFQLSGIDLHIVIDRKKAIQEALSDARKGDTIVVAGKGHETYQEIGNERIPFDDRAIVKAHLTLGSEG
jgi:UDP-N-acetylmuramoyl-L-alanyl-D-glutamate--2,6-diaminopimelate ligase